MAAIRSTDRTSTGEKFAHAKVQAHKYTTAGLATSRLGVVGFASCNGLAAVGAPLGVPATSRPTFCIDATSTLCTALLVTGPALRILAARHQTIRPPKDPGSSDWPVDPQATLALGTILSNRSAAKCAPGRWCAVLAPGRLACLGPHLQKMGISWKY
ncbi:hypothetical protein CFAM422_003514 [Trichoderma lentiforme]|uniref:Uncharacterized protein n=1 Tax=Trichoderma lentiforme TaxID=1567552 RepID=A0A9P5CH68_9HYPO|nr:hypothetical protein CFAM422_003514 [Trichoderma lentiforme]